MCNMPPASALQRRFLRTLGIALLIGAGLSGTLQVFALPPNIISQPASQSVSNNADVVFTVVADNPSPTLISFQWRRNGVNIPGTLASYGGSLATNTYSLHAVRSTDCGSYSVVAFNADGAVNSAVASLVLTNIPVLPVSDSFATRGNLGSTTSGTGRADNFGASKEAGEPDHGGKHGGASVWLVWTAPGNGIATFGTLGSGCDTTFGIYTGNTLDALVPRVDDDDDAGYLNSVVSFNVLEGTNYNIAIDGYYGDRGNLVLNWSFELTTDLLPVITTQPIGQTVQPGTVTVFSVTNIDTGLPIQYQWFQNGNALAGASASALVVPNVNPSKVGTYVVRLRSDQAIIRDTFSKGATLQINITGGGSDPNVAAQRKFREAIDSGTGPATPALGRGDGIRPSAAPAGGFTGTQIFNTYAAPKEPGEPNHCGEPGGASYWFSNLAPASGTLSVNTVGTGFNNVLAIYTGPGDSFSNLVNIARSSTNSGPGAEAVTFFTTSTQTNYIVVDGVGGTSGIVTLNYSLASPPIIITQPQSQTVSPGSNVTLTVVATGTPNLGYRWRSNSVNILNRTNTFLSLTNFQSSFEAGYDVVITNGNGAVTSSVASLYLNSPLRFTNTVTTSNFTLKTLLIGRAFTNYIIQSSTNLGTSNWLSLATNSSPVGLINYTDTNTPALSNRFFRARSQ